VLVVGLGNPGKKYEGNRHNLGFMIVDELRRTLSLSDYREKFSGVWSKGDDVSLLKPMTYMNLSGDSVQPCAAFLKVAPSDIVVVHDEVDLPFANVKIKVGGGHAGHNGLRSIIQRLGTADFVRVRAGVGRPPPEFRGEVADYLLADFNASERAELPDVIQRAVAAVRAILDQGAQVAMNALNAKAPARNAPAKAPPEVNPRLLEAVQQNRLVQLKYDGRLRVVEPHDYGVRKGAALLLAFQREEPQGWRTFNVAKISELTLLEQTFAGGRPAPSGQHVTWDELYGRAAAGEGTGNREQGTGNRESKRP